MTDLTPAARSVVRRWMYAERISEFASQSTASILGELLKGSSGDVELGQRNAWLDEIRVLQSLRLPDRGGVSGKIYLEYEIPRLGRRADAVLIVGHVIFVLEFKVGEKRFTREALDQVWDYALDLKNFHEPSHLVPIVPVLVATEAARQVRDFQPLGHADGVQTPVRASPDDLVALISGALRRLDGPDIDTGQWERGRYLPTPTIVEAAQALYARHSVEAIARSDAGAANLAITAREINRIIEDAKQSRRKAICFVTGVPGSGKTLVGLNVANDHLDRASETYAVFLSGNGPLVAVLREALARDRWERAKDDGIPIRKGEARKEVAAFVQNVHHFRDEYVRDEVSPPPEHVVLFDEAQRAWTREQTTAFMKRKKGYLGFRDSEPEFLISCLDRHNDWSVIVCLVGGGQEINTGEAGISAWLDAVFERFKGWEVHISKELGESEYRCREALRRVLTLPGARENTRLHLASSMRSFRAESLSRFVREVLDLERDAARRTLAELADRYPIKLTRSVDRAKAWLRSQARGSERYGIVVSSQAQRLKPYAIDVRVKTDPVKWFLDRRDDIRSSYFLEDVATEFQVQGLELDWVGLVWDGDLRFDGHAWSHNAFKGTRWSRVNDNSRQNYLKNAYRVLLTRARQGMVIVVPEGAQDDPTRSPAFYDPTYNYLKSLGLSDIAG